MRVFISILLIVIINRSFPQSNVCLNNQTDVGGMFSWVLSSNGYSSGDFNNDSKLDFIMPSNYSSTLALVLSTSSNTFAPLTTFTVDQIVANIVAADFNNDGNDDIAFSCYDSNKVVIMNGNGLGSFTATTKYNMLFPGGGGINSADFNNDGSQDLAVGTYSNFYVFLNNGSGGFSSLAYSFVGPILVDDFNNDNFKDLYIAGSPTSVFLKNTGFGNFILDNSTNLAVACSFDMNSDGLNDLVGIDSYSLFVSLNTGNFNFSTPTVVASGFQYPFTATKADINDDGLLDVVIPNGGQGYLAIHLNNGSGGFLAPIIYTANPGIILIQTIESKDIDNNGRDDIIVQCSNSGLTLFYNCLTTDILESNSLNTSIQIQPNPSTGTFEIKSGFEIRSIELKDFNGKNIFRSNRTDHINIQNYPSGIYFLRLETASGEVGNYKLIKTD